MGKSAVTIRRAIDGALDQWVNNPNIDFERYTNEVITLFDLPTRTFATDLLDHKKCEENNE